VRIAVVAALCVALGVLPAGAGAKSSLKPSAFASCSSLVGYARQHFEETKGVADVPVVPISTPDAPTGVFTGPRPVTATPPVPAAATTDNAGSSAGSASYSTTNVQEQGVDEPDIVKTDGHTIFAVSGTALRAVTVTDGVPTLASSLNLPGYGAQLLLRGTRLIAISSTSIAATSTLARSGIAHVPFQPMLVPAVTTVTEIDVHDPAAMKITRTMSIDGRFVDARQNGATARLVIASSPRAVTNTQAPDASSPSGWVPMRRFRSSLTTHHYVRPVSKCHTILRPRQFSGLGMLTILTIDLDHGLYEADSDALMADAQVVYGSTGSLYVATQKWVRPTMAVTDVPNGQTTVIDRFDVSDPDKTTLASTGEVPGFLLNQFSMSEDGGFLRVATTTQPTFWNGEQVSQTGQSQITVLDERGARMTPVGTLTGLGTGQKLYSVRFVGDTAYVVTFRQIDPLYVIDLSTPTAPKVAGQLELEGFSSYLQPLDNTHLLGIGSDVANNEPSGVQLELFDVSNPAAPRLAQKVTLPYASSAAQYDHHALLWWPATKLALLPAQSYESPQFAGAIGYRIDGSAITEIGRVAPDPISGFLPAVQRSLVIGDRVFTLSETGIMASSLDTLTRQAFAAFPTPNLNPPPPSPSPIVLAR
jgi:uncharacterized secreted protein with C-terminal beta-propeller domain